MKVKEVSVTASIAWSPAQVCPALLACGTTAKQLDAGLSTNACLTLYNLNLARTTLEMSKLASLEAPSRFHALNWSGVGSEGSGLIYGGCEDGGVYVYDAGKLMAGAKGALVGSTQGKHAGPVYTISCNYLKANVVACGSAESEVTVWDMSNLAAPIIPGKKLSLAAEVSCVEFNRQVEHIFASTCAGHCVVWDLRKQASIMTISDTVSRMKAGSIVWNPGVATQLVLASESDTTPWAQVWDLRYATAPIKTLEGHQRGILKAAWCSKDSNLLITTAKDGKSYVWNPNEAQRGQEVVAEFPTYNQWSFDLDWSERDPSLVALASVDSCVSVYSLLGGGLPPSQSDKFSQIADSFPGMEMPMEVPQGATPKPIRLRHPPKWLATTAGASFAFGGRLVSWSSTDRQVKVAQVVTEEELVQRSTQLEEALAQPEFAPYCYAKAETVLQPNHQVVWQYIGANFEASPRSRYMELLGYSATQVSSKLQPVKPSCEGVSPEDLADKIAGLGTYEGSTSSLDASEQFEMIASGQSFDKTPETEQVAESDGDSGAGAGVVSLKVEEQEGSGEGLITQALLVGDLESAVELCLKDGLYPHALTLAAHAGPQLFNKTRDGVLRQVGGGVASLVGAVVRGDLACITSTCSLANWKEALVAALTYSTQDQFPALAESLGERLEAVGDAGSLLSALICYVCAGSLDKFVGCWLKAQPNTSTPASLQELVEVIMALQRSLAASGRAGSLGEGTTVSSLMCQYASLLAGQGALATAASYLSSATQGEMVELRNRLHQALGYSSNPATQPRAPAAQPTHNMGRTPTPHTFPHTQQPTQFTPSVQDQQRSIYTNPVTPSVPVPAAQTPAFFSPAPAPHPAPAPIQMSPMVPQFGVPPLTPMQPSLAPPGPPPTAGPPPSLSMAPGGLRRGPASRYLPESAHTATSPAPGPSFHNPQINPLSPSPAPQFFTPAAPPTAPTQYMEPLQQQHQQPPPTQAPSRPPAALDSSVPRGWNDPPPVSSRKAKQQQLQQQQQQQQQEQQSEGSNDPAPIMCPVPGGSLPEPPQQQFMGFPSSQYGEVPGPMPGSTAPAAPAAAPEPAKGPLPQEHQVIQEVLNEVRKRCLQVVQNQQMKQRLEDIGVKMEVLYDKLRSGQLGPTSVSGVHRMVGLVQGADYRGALAVHAETVARGSFSELSAFMPSLKLLLQYCVQLQVFLQ